MKGGGAKVEGGDIEGWEVCVGDGKEFLKECLCGPVLSV